MNVSTSWMGRASISTTADEVSRSRTRWAIREFADTERMRLLGSRSRCLLRCRTALARPLAVGTRKCCVRCGGRKQQDTCPAQTQYGGQQGHSSPFFSLRAESRSAGYSRGRIRTVSTRKIWGYMRMRTVHPALLVSIRMLYIISRDSQLSRGLPESLNENTQAPAGLLNTPSRYTSRTRLLWDSGSLMVSSRDELSRRRMGKSLEAEGKPMYLDPNAVTELGDLAESAFERSPDSGDLIDY
ncbi:hypothetical protein B0H13DRAFT_1860271 [Mycena leptocephala]|nr:hypothetical protein B0H13DRAFT_1860271 [Mycena leptocephala]